MEAFHLQVEPIMSHPLIIRSCLPAYLPVSASPARSESYLPTYLADARAKADTGEHQSINQIRDTKLVQMLQDCEGKLM
jgi:hypothetical protein